jgi:hypothetical protein
MSKGELTREVLVGEAAVEECMPLHEAQMPEESQATFNEVFTYVYL